MMAGQLDSLAELQRYTPANERKRKGEIKRRRRRSRRNIIKGRHP
jgi:hypothetical protein